METVLLEINNEKAYQLLQSLEDLKLIKMLKKSKSEEVNLSDRFAGVLKLSETEYNKFQESLTESRNEWNKNTL
ncbi:MAG: hypothetical protein IE931_06850 [Sphingobacteriales bacterium]|nr:hypothetical protein [Sphingobacteriales bacterium]